MRPIGVSGLMGVDSRGRTADLHITIAESDFRGRGYGTDTAKLVLDYNHAGLRVYEKLGFREFGRRREACLMPED